MIGCILGGDFTKEKKGVVKYHNDLNTITFQGFNQVDFDFFMVLCSKFRNAKDHEVSYSSPFSNDFKVHEITIPIDEFKALAGYSPKTTRKRFQDELMAMFGKQLMTTGEIYNDGGIDKFVLFTKFRIDWNKDIIIARVNEEYLYILDEVTKNFTRFELQEFVSLESKHAKTLYRLLKQFRTTGIYIVTLEDFKRLFSVPASYSNKHLMDKIIKPSVKALKKYFGNLECHVQYENQRGRPVKGYEFTFAAEQRKKIKKPEPERIEEKPKNKFHNFDQRDYDYKDLEKKLTGQRGTA